MKRKLFTRALPIALLLTLTVGGVTYAQDGGPTAESQIDVIWLLLAAKPSDLMPWIIYWLMWAYQKWILIKSKLGNRSHYLLMLSSEKNIKAK